MIEYKFEEEKIVALQLADILQDERAKSLLKSGNITSKDDATYLSKFFWEMVTLSEEENRRSLDIPCEGNAQFWTEKLYNTFGGYLDSIGYGNEWDKEIDNA